MKKTFIAIMTIAAIAASCNKTEVIKMDRQEIGFGEVFVDNATKADYSSGAVVNSFKVYGTVTGNSNTVQIFNAVEVTNPTQDSNISYGKVWNYANPQYWIPSGEYHFAAIVDGAATATTALPVTIPFTVADGTDNKDLLYATADVTTNASATPTGSVVTVDSKPVVKFDFKHLLSKLQFTIANGTANESKYSYTVTGITVTGVAKNGTYTVATPKWEKDNDETVSLTFGTTTAIAGGANAVASATRQILPVEQTLAITITYDIAFNGTTIVTGATLSGTIPAKTYAASTVYNVTATIIGDQINFTLGTVGGWTSGDNINL